ncbi:alpha/beta hydrolase [Granulosicoccus antarcticus]|uniref:alpha/beta hydrolase n=1 Tax=Granulosicoccus antarcticus TaxID=437505 RepID=UPI00197AF81C|nr:alpha/beta hydrolase [Granulosicoccus antarcticus]
MTDFSNSEFIDWNDAFENGAYIPGAALLPDKWARLSAQLRDRQQAGGRMQADIRYGEGERQVLDIFHPEGESCGLVVLVHGGYWLRFDKSNWSFLAEGCLAHGWSVAIPSYRLAPDVPISDITQDVAAAVQLAAQNVSGPIRLVGHSAGAHLVARLLCADQILSEAVAARLAHVVPVSGIFDLRPLQANHMNESLQLDLKQAVAESPVAHQPRRAVPMTLWVGAEERPEFLRQTRLLCEKWSAEMDHIHACYEPGKNHFSVIDGLTRPDSALVRALLGID